MSQLAHLLPRVRGVLDFPVEDRIDFVYEDRWIGYPRAQSILKELDGLTRRDNEVRRPCRVLVGDPANGKTTLLRQCFKTHPYVQDEDTHVTMPTMLFETPPEPDERRLYSQILVAFGVAHRHDAPAGKLLEAVVDRMVSFETKLLMADEFHNMLQGTTRHQHQFLTALKNLLNLLNLSFAAAGTVDVVRALSTDSQFVSRFEQLELQKWGQNAETLSLIASLEMTLPFPEPSHLTERDMATIILGECNGTIGSVVKPVKEAAAVAIKNGKNKIDKDTLQGVVTDLQRRKVTGR